MVKLGPSKLEVRGRDGPPRPLPGSAVAVHRAIYLTFFLIVHIKLLNEFL